MRVLVTGATGFFGSRAAAKLSAVGEVFALVRPSSDRARLAALAPGARLVEGDVLDPASLRRAVVEVRPEICVHLAWYAVPGKYLEAPENLAHLRAGTMLVEALAEAGCRRLVTAGTCFEYDTSLGYLAESSATAPRFLYAACKRALGEVTAHAARLAGMSHVHARFFYQYGPHEHPARLVPAVVRALLAGEEAKTTAGEQVRDFLHVDDVAEAVKVLATAEAIGIVNVGSGVPVRVADLVRAAAAACGRTDLLRLGALPYREGDPMFVCADATKLRALGFRPSIDLEAGMADAVRFWRTQSHG